MPITLPSYVAPNELIQSAWGNGVVDALDELDDEKLDLTGGTVSGLLIIGTGIALPVTEPSAAGRATRRDYVDNRVPGTGGEQGPDNAGPTVAGNALSVNSFVLTAPATNGRVHGWGQATFTQTTSTDVFELSMTIDGNVVAASRTDNVPSGTNHTLQVTGSATVDTSGNVPVSMFLQRISGTGTATVGTTTPSSVLHAILIPTP